MASLPWGLLHRVHSRWQKDIAGVLLEDAWFYPVAHLPSAPLIGNLALDWRLANYCPQAPSVRPPNLVNRVLLERGHTSSFTHPLSVASSCTMAERTICETIWPEKLKIFTSWSITEKNCRPLFYPLLLVLAWKQRATFFEFRVDLKGFH